MTTQGSHRGIGMVKWFNTKSGFGFVTPICTSGSPALSTEDLFVHHSELVCNEDQFRYLVQGEYIEYVVTKTDDNRVTASDVTGIGRGPLMCETRHERSKESENGGESENSGHEGRYRGGGPRGSGNRTHHPGRGRGRKPELVAQVPVVDSQESA